MPAGLAIAPNVPNPKYADLGIAALVLVTIMLIAKYAKNFVANISVLLGIMVGGVVSTALELNLYFNGANAVPMRPLQPPKWQMRINLNLTPKKIAARAYLISASSYFYA